MSAVSEDNLALMHTYPIITSELTNMTPQTIECKKCGLQKSTVDFTGVPCFFGVHEFDDTPQPSKCCSECVAYNSKDHERVSPSCFIPSCPCHIHEESPDDEFRTIKKSDYDKQFPGAKEGWSPSLSPTQEWKLHNGEVKVPEWFMRFCGRVYEEGQDSAIYAMDLQAQSHWFEEGRKKGRGNIGALRQWLNERTETRLITNEDIVTFLDL